MLEDLKNLHSANVEKADRFKRGLEKVNLATVKALQDYLDFMQRTRGRGAVLTDSTSISRSADFVLSKGSPLAGYMMKESEESQKISKLLKAPPHQLVELALEGHVNLKDFCAKNASLLETQMLMKIFLSEGGNPGITTENGKFRFIIMPKKSAKKLDPLF